jgi:DNA-binding NarL/FixJ family response regulator
MDIIVVSPRLLLRRALCNLLQSSRDFQVTVDVDRVYDGAELPEGGRAAVFLLDAEGLPEHLQILARIGQRCPRAKVLLLSDEVDDDFEVNAIRAGAAGILSIRSDPQTLGNALRAVEAGEIWIGHRAAARLIGGFIRGELASQKHTQRQLTEREREVLGLVAAGLRNKEIAVRLSVSESTVKTHLLTIYRKLEVSGRLAAAMEFFQQAGAGQGQLPKNVRKLPVQMSPNVRAATHEPVLRRRAAQ